MGTTQTAEYLIAVLIAMVFVVTFRRKMPKALELAVWMTLVWVCVLAITSTPNPQARALTTATVWGVGRIESMIVDQLWQGALRWIYGVRFVVATWVVVVFLIDLLLLALVSTRRQADAWIPVTKLGEWLVLPRLDATQPERAALPAVDDINRRFNVWVAAAAAATVTWSTFFFTWLRDDQIPTAARGLKNIELGAGAAWRRVAAGRPQVGQVRISRVVSALTTAVSSSRRRSVVGVGESASIGPDIVDITRADERKAKAGRRLAKAATTPRKPRRRSTATAPKPEVRTNKSGSKKQNRQGRLAS